MVVKSLLCRHAERAAASFAAIFQLGVREMYLDVTVLMQLVLCTAMRVLTLCGYAINMIDKPRLILLAVRCTAGLFAPRAAGHSRLPQLLRAAQRAVRRWYFILIGASIRDWAMVAENVPNSASVGGCYRHCFINVSEP